MLSVPEYGWIDPNTGIVLAYAATNFSLGDAKYELENTEFIAIDWLEAAVYGLKNFFRPFTVRAGFYSDNNDYVNFFCTVTKNFCYVVCANAEKILATHAVTTTMLDFCRELHADISKDTFEWAYFEYYGDEFDGNEYRE